MGQPQRGSLKDQDDLCNEFEKKLVHFAQKALQSLAGSQKSMQELERTFSYLNELHLIAQTLDGRLHSTDFFIKSCLVIQKKAYLLTNRHDYLTGLKEGSLLWGTHEHVSDEGFFKAQFFTLNVKEYMELGQTMLKLAANFEISDMGHKTAEIESTLNEVISILLLIGKYFQPNVLYARKPQFLFELKQNSKKLGK